MCWWEIPLWLLCSEDSKAEILCILLSCAKHRNRIQHCISPDRAREVRSQSGPTSWLRSLLNLHRSASPATVWWRQRLPRNVLKKERVITPVNSFKNFSFIMAVYGENAFWASGDFVAAVSRMGTGNKNWKRGWALTVTCAVLWYIHDMRGREVWKGRALPEKNHTANTEIKGSWL